MYLNENEFLEPMKVVYELKKELDANPKKIEEVHALTLDNSRPNQGLSGINGLYGTEAWWNNIDKGVIPTRKVSGVIEELYVAGMEGGDVNEFKFLSDDDWSTKSESIRVNNENDRNLFKVGSRVEILYVIEELKSSGHSTRRQIPLLLEMAVSASV